ncbi:MAG: hypothetical protein AB1705_09895 [Verrucomicrobiota bacterium]
MITYPSKINGGRTIILPSLDEAIQRGRHFVQSVIGQWKQRDPKEKIEVQYVQRPNDDEIKKLKDDLKAARSEAEKEKLRRQLKELERDNKSHTITVGTHIKSWEHTLTRYEQCVREIAAGSPKARDEINRSARGLVNLVLDITPQLAVNHRGFELHEEGFDAASELIAAGEPRCCLRRKQAGPQVKPGAGDGAYRIILNTDVAWWGRPADNSALMGALVLLLQTFGPVEVWIQQGWLGGAPRDGVTLFKLDFTGSFEPTQLAFWVGGEGKDIPFSYAISRGCGRDSTGPSEKPEISCDLYLRGDGLTQCGIHKDTPPTALRPLMVQWLAETVQKIVFPNRDDLESYYIK